MPAEVDGRSLSYETMTPYAPFVDLLENFFRLQPEETDLDKYDAITTRLAELFPNARLVEIDDSYTLLPEDQPKLLTQAIAEFLGETSA